MIYVISPAKKLDETPMGLEYKGNDLDLDFHLQASRLINKLKNLEPHELSDLMNISTNLAQLNYERFQNWHYPFSESKAKPALFMFKGDVYQGIDALHLNRKNLNYLNKNLYILSGLYGLLGAFDKILPYRLEMGTQLINDNGKNLYAFWGNLITENLNKKLAQHADKVLINLASTEYFKSIKQHNLQAKVITPIFKDWKNGNYKIISFYAKKARGMMVRYAAENKIKQVEDLKNFDSNGYKFDSNLSTEINWVFTRDL